MRTETLLPPSEALLPSSDPPPCAERCCTDHAPLPKTAPPLLPPAVPHTPDPHPLPPPTLTHAPTALVPRRTRLRTRSSATSRSRRNFTCVLPFHRRDHRLVAATGCRREIDCRRLRPDGKGVFAAGEGCRGMCGAVRGCSALALSLAHFVPRTARVACLAGGAEWCFLPQACSGGGRCG
jgi:hypothetical protein